MKKISILLLSVVTMGTAFVSCEKDSDSPSESKASIVGTWKMKTAEIIINDQSSGAQDPTPTCTAAGKVSSMTFKSDNTYSETDYDSNNDCAAVDNTGSYTLSSDQKTITLDNKPSTVLKLTSTDLQIQTTVQSGDYTLSMIRNFKK